MKVLVSIALIGVMLCQLCNAQTLTCTVEEIQSLSEKFATCTTTCIATVCDCCTQALAAGSSDSNYDCCSGYSGLLECQPDTAGLTPCAALTGDGNGNSNGDGNGDSNGDSGGSTATAVGVICGIMVLASSIVNQFIL